MKTFTNIHIFIIILYTDDTYTERIPKTSLWSILSTTLSSSSSASNVRSLIFWWTSGLTFSNPLVAAILNSLPDSFTKQGVLFRWYNFFHFFFFSFVPTKFSYDQITNERSTLATEGTKESIFYYYFVFFTEY